MLGIARNEGVAYIVEESAATRCRSSTVWLRGPRQGYLVPIHAGTSSATRTGDRAKIAEMARGSRCHHDDVGGVMLSTRIVQRRALRIAGPTRAASSDPPVRPSASPRAGQRGTAPAGKTTVTGVPAPAGPALRGLDAAGGEAAIRTPSRSGNLIRRTKSRPQKKIPGGGPKARNTVHLLTTQGPLRCRRSRRGVEGRRALILLRC